MTFPVTKRPPSRVVTQRHGAMALMLSVVLALSTVLSSVLIPVFASPAWAEDFKRLPWHLMDYRYEFDRAQPFDTLAITLDITADPDPDEFFYLCALWGYIGEDSFYLGLQSDLHQGLGERGYTGPGIIFTRWGTGVVTDGRPAADGWVVPPSPHTPDEGLSLSVRRPFHWTDGRYTFVLQKRPGTGLTLSSWIDLLIFDHQNSQWVDGGGLRFPTNEPVLGRRPVTFAELYGRSRSLFPDALSQARGFDPITLIIHPLVINGEQVAPVGHSVQPKDVPGTVTENQQMIGTTQGVRITISPEAR